MSFAHGWTGLDSDDDGAQFSPPFSPQLSPQLSPQPSPQRSGEFGYESDSSQRFIPAISVSNKRKGAKPWKEIARHANVVKTEQFLDELSTTSK